MAIERGTHAQVRVNSSGYWTTLHEVVLQVSLRWSLIAAIDGDSVILGGRQNGGENGLTWSEGPPGLTEIRGVTTCRTGQSCRCYAAPRVW